MPKPIVNATTHALHDVDTLRKHLAYDPETGVLSWLIPPNSQFKVGDIAGSINKDGHRYIHFRNKCYGAHRLAWAHFHGETPADFVDHKNGRRDDNRITNLRKASPAINSQNQRLPHRNSATQVLGVHKRGDKFVARIHLRKKTQHLGTFTTAQEAHAEYVSVKRQQHEGCTL